MFMSRNTRRHNQQWFWSQSISEDETTVLSIILNILGEQVIELRTLGHKMCDLLSTTSQGVHSILFCYMNCKINRKIHKYKVHFKKEQVSQYMHINFIFIFKECLSR